MIEENLRLIGQKVKIISPKMRLHIGHDTDNRLESTLLESISSLQVVIGNIAGKNVLKSCLEWEWCDCMKTVDKCQNVFHNRATTNYSALKKSCNKMTMYYYNFCLLILDIICKQYGSRSGPTKTWDLISIHTVWYRASLFTENWLIRIGWL